MGISTREKNILILAGLVALIFLATNLSPRISGFYDQRQNNVENVLLEIAREKRLIEETETWKERRISVEESQAEFERQIFNGDTIPVIEASIQTELSKMAEDSDITVNSTRLAESIATDSWLMISQEMSFRTNDAGNTVIFLKKLRESEPRLRVTEFSINRSRNQYNGSITVVGFSRSANFSAQVLSAR
ncbi:MAG: hypothetical protein ACI8V0_002682 [Pseudohongiellaceae bacterium]|jgi:hypothetical protein